MKSYENNSVLREISEIKEKLFYNHRKYFLYGYIVLFLSIIPVMDSLAAICFLTSLLSIYFFAKGFSLRNVLLLHYRGHPETAWSSPDIPPLPNGSGRAPQKALLVDDNPEAEESPEGGSGEAVWEVDEADFSSPVPVSGVTLGIREGKTFNLAGIEIERYMAIFILTNILFFGSYLGFRIWSGRFCLLIVISLFLFLAAILDKWRNGIPLYPVYLSMVQNGLLFDSGVNKVVPAEYWFGRHLKKDREEVLDRDTLMVNNWRPHSYVLTNRGIYLGERKGLISGRRFLYIPLLSLKGMKLENQKYDRNGLKSLFISLIFVFFWWPLIIFTILEGVRILMKRGKLIQGRALNLLFTLTREKDSIELMDKRMIEIDSTYHKRITERDAQEELGSYAPFEKFPPAPGLKEVKKGVRSASTGIIIPVFFYSMLKLMDILDVDTSGMIIFVFLVMIFAFYRIGSAIKNAWGYQLYLERPEKGMINLGFMKLSFSEALIILGYIIVSAGILWAISEDLLTLAFIPGVIGGILILAGRFTFDSIFKGIDYEDKSGYEPAQDVPPMKRLFREHRAKLTPAISFIIILILMAASLPYFGLTRAEVPEEYLDARAGNNWRHLPEHDEDMVGLMGMFGLSIRIYEDNAEDGDGYPAFLSVVTLKFPVMPEREDMLDEMRKYLQEYSEDERVTLEEPPIEGERKTAQGYTYLYFIYNGTAQNGTTRFSVGKEMRIVCTAFKADDEKSFVITVGIAQVSVGRLVDIELPPPLPQPPNPTDTRDFTNWNELKDELIPNVRI